ncbi:MAG: NAD(P)-binding domain-containing protein [Gammaproteobacteria bacterium]|nr:NAD(P)-binding domain-containing protein [Gammaproteobacteria bacterium]
MTRIGVLGFGEAGSMLAKVLADAGAVVDAYDQAWDRSDAERLRKHSADHSNIKCCLLPELLASAEIILSTVTTDAALDVANACVPSLRPQQIYCDLNSTAPAVKLRLHDLLRPTGAEFVEGAILGAIGITGANTQILLGGTRAGALSQTLNRFGLNTSPYSRDIGKASTFKMLRSIFSKGLEALIIEFLMAGHKAGLQHDLWQEVATLMTERGFEDVARNWVCSHGVAHERRYHEMVQVIDLLKHMQFDPIMTEATNRFFERSTDLQLSRDFVGKPDLMDDVIEALLRHTSQRHSQ